ncbi:hypothetical protein [Nocardia crassostreae]|uniref:hypothetical protein n=1 Tax=Nocardia crassostreae TaxID=53428 RepID=UPI0012F83B6C|nr:hypothetical protein [Nocardia crassostreae]
MDLVVAGVIYLGACAAAWVLAAFVPEYQGLVREAGEERYLPIAYVIAWVGIVVTVMGVPVWMLRAVRLGQRAWTTALVAFPLLAGSWVLGLLAAIVAVSV